MVHNNIEWKVFQLEGDSAITTKYAYFWGRLLLSQVLQLYSPALGSHSQTPLLGIQIAKCIEDATTAPFIVFFLSVGV